MGFVVVAEPFFTYLLYFLAVGLSEEGAGEEGAETFLQQTEHRPPSSVRLWRRLPFPYCSSWKAEGQEHEARKLPPLFDRPLLIDYLQFVDLIGVVREKGVEPLRAGFKAPCLNPIWLLPNELMITSSVAE